MCLIGNCNCMVSDNKGAVKPLLIHRLSRQDPKSQNMSKGNSLTQLLSKEMPIAKFEVHQNGNKAEAPLQKNIQKISIQEKNRLQDSLQTLKEFSNETQGDFKEILRALPKTKTVCQFRQTDSCATKAEQTQDFLTVKLIRTAPKKVQPNKKFSFKLKLLKNNSEKYSKPVKATLKLLDSNLKAVERQKNIIVQANQQYMFEEGQCQFNNIGLDINTSETGGFVILAVELQLTTKRTVLIGRLKTLKQKK